MAKKCYFIGGQKVVHRDRSLTVANSRFRWVGVLSPESNRVENFLFFFTKMTGGHDAICWGFDL